MKRTTCTIHLDNLKHNVNIIKSLTRGASITAIIKADAYGHGATNIYPTLKECGIDNFAVAFLDEGIELRKSGLKDPILLLANTQDEDFEDLVKYDLTQAISTFDEANKINEIAKKYDKIQPIELKLDTGMLRVGFQCYNPYIEKTISDIEKVSKLSNIKIVGAFTHFANADEKKEDFASLQLQRYTYILNTLKERGVSIPKRHVSNTPSILERPEFQQDYVRPGDILYGILDESYWVKYGFKEVMSWEAYISLVKDVPVGETVGYGRTFKVDHPMKIATIPVGFADGYSRALSNKGYVVINNKIAPIVGRVCMDQFMVDVTDIPDVKRGDMVKLLDGDKISIFKMAELINRDVDEIVLGVSKRVPKVFIK